MCCRVLSANFVNVYFSSRIPQLKKGEKGEEIDPVQPVYVGEFPQVVRDEQASFLQRRVPG